MRDTLIDLGEVPATGPGEPDPALPGPPLPYRWILGVLAVALLAVLGGAGPPPPPLPAPVVLPMTQADTFRVDGDRLFVVGPGEPVGTVVRTHTIRSFDLPGMNLVGTHTVTVSGDLFTVADGGDGLLLVSYSDYQYGTSRTVAVRAGAGQPIWDRPATLSGLSPDRAVAVVHETTGPYSLDGREIWRGLDPRTGAVRWSVEQPENGLVTLRAGRYWAGFPDVLYTLHGDGRLVAHDGLTGAVTATGRIAPPAGPDTTLWAAGGLVVVGRGTEETVTYDDRTLTERWRRAGPILSEDGYPQDCRPMICAATRPSGIVVVDPATGQEIQRVAGYDSTEPIGDRVLVSKAGQDDSTLAVLDPRTGRITAEAAGWVSGGPGPEPGTAYVHRFRQADDTVRYGVLDLGTGRVRMLGAAGGIAGNCQFAPGVLLCRRVDFSMVVRRL